MSEMRLGAVEARFADLIWAHEPLSSRELVALSEEALGWKKSTTYTVLKKFCDRGFFRNENGRVSAVLSREEFYSKQSREYVQESFGGSLPAFLAAFAGPRRQTLSEKEWEELRRLLEVHDGKGEA